MKKRSSKLSKSSSSHFKSNIQFQCNIGCDWFEFTSSIFRFCVFFPPWSDTFLALNFRNFCHLKLQVQWIYISIHLAISTFLAEKIEATIRFTGPTIFNNFNSYKKTPNWSDNNFFFPSFVQQFILIYDLKLLNVIGAGKVKLGKKRHTVWHVVCMDRNINCFQSKWTAKHTLTRIHTWSLFSVFSV